MPLQASTLLRLSAVLIAFYHVMTFGVGLLGTIWIQMIQPQVQQSFSGEIDKMVFLSAVGTGFWLAGARWPYVQADKWGAMIERPSGS